MTIIILSIGLLFSGIGGILSTRRIVLLEERVEALERFQ